MPKYPPAAGVKPEDLVKALVRHKPESEDADGEEGGQKEEEPVVPLTSPKSGR